MTNTTRVLKIFPLFALTSLLATGMLTACNGGGGGGTPLPSGDPPEITYFINTDEEGAGLMWTNVNTAFTAKSPTVSGGPITSFAISPALPAGVTINATTGVISGTPTDTSAVREYRVIATGTGGSDTATVLLGSLPASFPLVLLEKGEERFEASCTHCHGPDGKGAIGPPLNPSDYLMADRVRGIRIQMLGLPNRLVDTASVITVNGVEYEGSMFAPQGNDSTIASVMTFVRTMFNGAMDPVTPAEVGVVRDALIALDTAGEYNIEGH